MKLDIIAAAVAAAAGVVIAFVNYLLSRQVLLKSPDKYALITVVRQAVQVGFLVAVYFVGKRLTGTDITYLLVGAVLGMTVPMLLFTKKLLALNGTVKGKEVNDNG